MQYPNEIIFNSSELASFWVAKVSFWLCDVQKVLLRLDNSIGIRSIGIFHTKVRGLYSHRLILFRLIKRMQGFISKSIRLQSEGAARQKWSLHDINFFYPFNLISHVRQMESGGCQELCYFTQVALFFFQRLRTTHTSVGKSQGKREWVNLCLVVVSAKKALPLKNSIQVHFSFGGIKSGFHCKSKLLGNDAQLSFAHCGQTRLQMGSTHTRGFKVKWKRYKIQ